MARLLGPIWAALAMTAALAAGSPALAADRLSIKPWLIISQEYDSNVLYSERAEQGDSFTRIGPGIEVSSRGERQIFVLSGELDGRRYQRYDELDVLNPSLHLEMSRAITPRFTTFANAEVVERTNTDPIEEDELSVSGRADLARHFLQGGVAYTLDPLTTVRLMLSSGKVDYGETELVEGGTVPRLASDYDSRGMSVAVQRSLGDRDAVGVWVTYDIFDFRTPPVFGAVVRAATEDRRMRLGMSWEHVFSPTLSMALRGGPRWLRSDGGQITGLVTFRGDVIPVYLPNRSTDSLEFNGDLTLTKQTSGGRFEFNYSRDTRPSTDQGTSRNVDSATVRFRRRIGRRFGLSFRVLWRDEESSSDVDRLEHRTFGVDGELTWRIRSDLYTFVGYSFHDRDTERNLASSSVEDQRFRVGFRYAHDFDLF